MPAAQIASLPRDTKVQVHGVTGTLVGSRIIERGKNKGLLEVIVYGLHLGNRRDHSKTFFLAPDAACDVDE
jgi:hypothetical protein